MICAGKNRISFDSLVFFTLACPLQIGEPQIVAWHVCRTKTSALTAGKWLATAGDYDDEIESNGSDGRCCRTVSGCRQYFCAGHKFKFKHRYPRPGPTRPG